MKQTIQLQIPTPCHENWDNMTSTQQGRFCMSCQKQVVDFSIMSDQEILSYISTASSNVCGRIADDQLNRELIAPPEPRKIWWRYWMSVAASVIMLSSKTYAQGTVTKQVIVKEPSPAKQGEPLVIRMGKVAAPAKNEKNKIQIRGRVVDHKNNPVPFASIRLNGGSAGIAADSAGNFMLTTTENISGIGLTVSSVGYETKNIQVGEPADIKSITMEGENIRLDIGDVPLVNQSLKDVVITAYSNRRISSMMGSMISCVNVSVFEKTKARVKEVLGINEIKVYPNPVAANGPFNIGFNLKDAGDYALQFTDASGKIIAAQQLKISSKSQVENFSGIVFPASGIYFVSVRGKQNSKMYTTKLVVQ